MVGVRLVTKKLVTIMPTQPLDLLTTQVIQLMVVTSSPTLGYDPSQYGNPAAKWEATLSNNIGLDAAL